MKVHRAVLACALACAAMPAAALAAPGPLGSLTQVAGTPGCLTTQGLTGQCTDMRGGSGASDLEISPDGRSAYLDAYGGVTNGTLSVFSRDPVTGLLAQLAGTAGCLSDDGASEDGAATCTNARLVDSGDGHSIAISADGRFVYVAAQSPVAGVAIFARDTTTGALTQLAGTAGCVSADGSSEDGPNTCADGRALEDGVSSVAITPDGAYLYATTYPNRPAAPGDSAPGIAIFSRDATTGALTQLAGKDGCTTSDGSDVDGATDCNAAPALDQVFEVAMPDNTFVYAANRVDDLVAALRRTATGGLVPLAGTAACISDTGNSFAGANTCAKGRGLNDAERIVLAPGGRFLYTQGYNPANIAVLQRDPATGALSQPAGPAFCATSDGNSVDGPGSCLDARNLESGYAGAMSADGQTLYYANDSNTGGLAIFHVDPGTGALAQLQGTLGCVSTDGSSTDDGAGTCTAARAVSEGYGVTLGAGGRDVYVASDAADGGVAIFHAELPPSCSGATVIVPHETPTAVPLACSDPNGDPFGVAVAAQPVHGTLAGNASSGSLTYTPAPGFHGVDSFAFAANDGSLASAAAADTLNVSALACSAVVAKSVKRKTILNKGLTLTLTCATAAASSAKWTVTKAVKRKLHLKSTTLGSGHSARKAGAVKVRIKLSSVTVKRLKKVKRTHKLTSFRSTLTITTSDAAGKVASTKVGVTIKL